jgi:hypothetical protein
LRTQFKFLLITNSPNTSLYNKNMRLESQHELKKLIKNISYQ